MTARACVRCGTTFDGYGKTRYCSQQCRCGTDAGYNSGCSCNDCRRAHARARNYARMNTRHWVPALGSQRRIRALARLGWSSAELSRRLGKHRSYLLKVMSNDRLEQLTATAIATLYEDLCMTRCTSATAGRTATDASARGWPPPLAWDDIDDPNECPPESRYAPSRVDVPPPGPHIGDRVPRYLGSDAPTRTGPACGPPETVPDPWHPTDPVRYLQRLCC
jgi:hypothetical protein